MAAQSMPVVETAFYGWKIWVQGEHVRVTRPDGSVSEWHERPATNGSGLYDLCLVVARETPGAAAWIGTPKEGGKPGITLEADTRDVWANSYGRIIEPLYRHSGYQPGSWWFVSDWQPRTLEDAIGQMSEMRDDWAEMGRRLGFSSYADPEPMFIRASVVGNAASMEPWRWALRIGDSDVWGFTGTQEEADFIGAQSGLKFEKRPCYSAPVIGPDMEAARDIIIELLQCAEVGRYDGKLTAHARDWLASNPPVPAYTPQQMAASFRAGQNTERMQQAEQVGEAMDREQLGDLVEGMAVSVDVDGLFSTDGRRLFGTITAVQHEDGEKGGLMLLVQEPEPNWKPEQVGEVQGDASELLAEMRDVEDYFKDVDPNPIHLATVQAAISALAARQPGAQEPVGFQIMRRSADDTCFNGRWDNPPSGFHDDREYYVSRPGTFRIRDIYAAPPAQGVNLGPLRVLLQSAAMFYDRGLKGRCRGRIDDALALIDQRDAAPGAGNG